MKIVSWNINSLRKHKEAFLSAIAELQPDIFCLQEIRGKAEACSFEIDGYTPKMNPAQQSGFYGTGVYAKDEIEPYCTYDFPMPDGVHQGRIIKMEFDEFVLINTYWPFSSNKKFLEYRLEWCKRLEAFVHEIQETKPVIICGDMNTVQASIDAYDGKATKNAGCFYQEEQEAFRQLLANEHLVDTYRYLHPTKQKFSVWPNAKDDIHRKNNEGYRIDFFLISESILDKVRTSDVLCNVMGSDHCPIMLDIDINESNEKVWKKCHLWFGKRPEKFFVELSVWGNVFRMYSDLKTTGEKTISVLGADLDDVWHKFKIEVDEHGFDYDKDFLFIPPYEQYPGSSDGDDILYDKAMKLLLTAHKGQKDKADKDYRLHPLRVSDATSGIRSRMVALLHDLLEDTSYSADNLKEIGFPDEVIDGILSVTRREGESYRDFIKRARCNYFGRRVKEKDLLDNLDIFRLEEITEKDRVRLNKYLHSYRYITTGDESELVKIND